MEELELLKRLQTIQLKCFAVNEVRDALTIADDIQTLIQDRWGNNG